MRADLELAVCVGPNCSAGHCGHERIDRMADAHQAAHGKRVLASTLRDGLCVTCARTLATEDDYLLRLDVA